MNPSARPSRISDQRLQRLSLWLALTLAHLVAPVLNALAPRAAARLLNHYAEIARMLLVLRAVKRIAFRAPRLGSIPIDSRRYTTRRVAGAALRRALRGGALSDRARALCAMLADAERWIAYVTRRLQRGLTKLRRLPMPRAIIGAVTLAPPALRLATDTS